MGVGQVVLILLEPKIGVQNLPQIKWLINPRWTPEYCRTMLNLLLYVYRRTSYTVTRDNWELALTFQEIFWGNFLGHFVHSERH